MHSRTYHINGSIISLHLGDIRGSQAEVLVSSDDTRLLMGGGVSRALLHAAGAAYRDACRKILAARHERGRVQPGDVLVTPAGELSASYVLHAITRDPEGHPLPADAIVRQACHHVMRLLPLLGCRSVAFPSIGTGYAGFDPVAAAEQMAAVLGRCLLEADESFEVELWLLDRPFNFGSAQAFHESFDHFLERSLAVGLLQKDGAWQLVPPHDPGAPTADRERQRQFDIYGMLRRLDNRRSELDAAVHEAIGADGPDAAAQLELLTRQLEAVTHLRGIYETELTLKRDAATQVPRSVFLSSTWEDLQDYRRAARGVIEALDLTFIGMEEFPPSGTAPVDFIRREVTRAELYIGVLGMRYGFVDPALGFSMTELEYRQAVASGKRRCLFVMSDRAQIPLAMVDTDADRYRKLLEFRGRVLKENVVQFFENPADLASKLEGTLRKQF